MIRTIKVAPFAGAWIEITYALSVAQISQSLPSRERGLKSVTHTAFNTSDTSLPSRERGLKSISHTAFYTTDASLPSRECGFKYG